MNFEKAYPIDDPDDLFIRFTIPEIRNIQLRLRADADAKQEELRLMVGERYRDLLQASTSIISIAGSSRHVTRALAEMRNSVTPDEHQKKPQSSSIQGKDDVHLKVLQSLSAHLKLLLDAPEHLWRLLEKKQYFHAAWLFLLARVVHRALVTEDPEEATWQNEGINVLAQFPLVQRQWDTVAQFRPQIAHRATQYLRETQISSEGACSTILTLHLLDSLPLTETLSMLLSQRSKTLNALLSRNLDFRTPSRPGSPIFKSRQKNREVTSLLLAPPSSAPMRSRNRREVMRDVRNAVLELLEVIWGTMAIARELFQESEEEGRRQSLVERSLEAIQSDCPSESVLRTSSLLTTLPSSTHLLTLPPSILSYKPYIDLTSPSAHVDPSILHSKLSIWFTKATEGFAGRLQVWFSGLRSIREVWSLRRKVLERLQGIQGLDNSEKGEMQSVLNSTVTQRIGEVANAALEILEISLEGTLRSVLQEIREGTDKTHIDTAPSEFLFSPPPLPSILQMSTSTPPGLSPFKQFKEALRQRVDGRTPSLHRVLGEIEAKAQEMEENLNVMDEDQFESRNLQDKVMTLYYQAAHASSIRICQILNRTITEEVIGTDKDPDQVGNVVIFVGRLCYYLSLSSCIRGLRYEPETTQTFHETLNALHERSIECWRDQAISTALKQCDTMFGPFPPALATEEFTWPSQPSPQLINALLSIISSLGRLGLPRSALIAKGVPKQIMQEFQFAVARKVSVESCAWRRDGLQLLWDLTFLLKISSAPPEESTDTDDPLEQKLSYYQERLQSAVSEQTISDFQAHLDHSIDKYLPRSQTLLAPLLFFLTLPKSYVNGKVAMTTPKMSSTAMLPLGPPKTDQEFWPAIETVKPSTRFGLLLVGSTAIR